MASQIEAEKLKSGKPLLRFISIPHGNFPENPQTAKTLMTALENINIIFLEATGSDLNRSEMIENQFNLALSQPKNLDQPMQVKQKELIAALRKRGGFGNILVANLAKSGKKLFLVDIDSAHPAFALEEQIDAERAALANGIIQGYFSEARAKFPDLCLKQAKLQTERENVVKVQVAEKIRQLQKEGLAVSASIIQGPAHSTTSLLFDNEEFKVEGIILPEQMPFDVQIWLKLKRGQPIEKIEYDRSVLADYVLSHTIQTDASQEEEEAEYLNFYRLVNSLTPEQVEQAYSDLEHFYIQELRRQSGGRRLNQKDKEDYAPYVFPMAVNSLFRQLQFLAEKK